MHYANLRNVDLNLLLALNALMEERSVTGAARRMFISQPAMSRAVDRLQEMFNDELLVRTSNGYEPTHRASVIYAELQELLPKMAGLFSEAKFDPANEADLFRIESTDWGATVLVPGLIKVLAERAPGVRIDIIPRAGGLERLETNEVDLLFTGSGSQESKPDDRHVSTECLFREKLVCLVRKGYPLAKDRFTLKQYLNVRHVFLTPMQGPKRSPLAFWAERAPDVAKAFERLGKKPDVRVQIPYFVPLRSIVENSDLVATVPLQIARQIETPGLRIVSPPPEFHSFNYNQIWHSRNDTTPLHKWIRGLIRAVAERLG
jgi:DNA-binding transcriptional LysR family regulator